MNNASDQSKSKVRIAARVVAIIAVLVLVVSQTTSAQALTAMLILIAFVMAGVLWFRWVVNSHGLSGEKTNDVG